MKQDTLLASPKASLKTRTTRKSRKLTNDQLQETIGNKFASAWRVAPGVIWIQLRDPKLAERLRAVEGRKLVAWSEAGPYLRTFELNRSLAWAGRWINRAMNAQEAS